MLGFGELLSFSRQPRRISFLNETNTGDGSGPRSKARKEVEAHSFVRGFCGAAGGGPEWFRTFRREEDTTGREGEKESARSGTLEWGSSSPPLSLRGVRTWCVGRFGVNGLRLRRWYTFRAAMRWDGHCILGWTRRMET
ncbi:aldehyde dehydrogenase [Anopheles sinensis]|uniref:Aldehyde dehydrogenase n=1 Tax=Anopheles sinensis TaxID=74873 RepID=A0A084W6B1_ANOSI|nr:aldehyde dehydrogenase [Anopheles sinensis]